MVNVLDKVQPKNKKQLKQLIDYAFKHNIYDLNFIDTSKITDMSNVIDISFMFYGCHNFNCDLSRWNVSKVENMYSIFGTCKNFIGKGLENWNTSNVIDMGLAFCNCEKFDCDLSNWNVSNVVNMYCTFDYCKNFIGKGLENWNVSNVINMTGMFTGCEKFDCDLSNWDVSNVIDMKFTFNYCLNFKGKGLENWDVSNIHAIYCVFKNCVNLTIPSWYKSNA